MGEGQDASNKKTLTMFFVFLCMVAIGLAISIVLTIGNRNNADQNNNQQLDTSNNINEDESAKVSDYIAETNQAIKEAKTNEERIEIYNKRIDYLSGVGEYSDYADQILADTIAIDEIEQSISSAGQVINMANSYDKSDIAAKYELILEQRMREQNVNNEGRQGIG